MPELILGIDGETHRIPFEPGPSVRDILDVTDFRVRSGCRGIGACGLCRVRVAGGEAGEPTQNEHLHLSSAQLSQGVRLACQISPRHDMQIEILNPAPPSNWKTSPDAALLHILREQEEGRWLPSGVKHPCGVAVDLGTTHLCLSLFDLAKGRWLADRWGRNPQQNFGADVVTRLAAAAESPDAAREMSRLAVAAIGEALLDIATREGFDLRRIVNVTVVGNTAMLALLSGRNFGLLLQPDYWTRPVDCTPLETSGWVAEWEINPVAEVDVVAPLAGFVGSDLLAGLVSTRFTEGASPALFIDFGTNSEIALWSGEALWVTSSAGGPAFESSGISCGAPAEAGAVFRVNLDSAGDLACQIIGDDRARGVCGSGLVDLIACLLGSGRLTSAGKFAGGETGYIFSAGGTELTLTKGDVDLIQRAKAAIGVGIRALCGNAGVGLNDLRRVCVGGAFGRYLDVGNAQVIGLLPPVPPETVELAGNTALAGCCDVMLSSLAAERLKALRSRARLVNLARYPDFDQAFFENLYLQPLREA
ncbi:ASKHA domain-containing protein [Sulfuricella sp.]|uniref:ASKHA domain-containing protein n=1 Tax=Sulfuricella sp. TaxID=2099377 RepID=UPI002CB33E1F|nr:ASKHA domain-containing protein [Sulfuricella sp.]HUX63328.1 ASKHA domain-containing protein [Sulfuricella sp.]